MQEQKILVPVTAAATLIFSFFCHLLSDILTPSLCAPIFFYKALQNPVFWQP